MTKARYDAARAAYHAAAHEYEAAIYNHVGTLVREHFPTAAKANVYGTVNEDGTPILRVVTIVDADDKVLAAVDEPEEAWEDFVDEVGTEYLDVLIDLTGDDYLGENEIDTLPQDVEPVMSAGVKVSFGEGCDNDTLNAIFGALIGWVVAVTDSAGTNDVRVLAVAPEGRWAITVRDYDADARQYTGPRRDVDFDDLRSIFVY